MLALAWAMPLGAPVIAEVALPPTAIVAALFVWVIETVHRTGKALIKAAWVDWVVAPQF